MIKVQIIEDNFEQANMLAEILTNDNNIKIVNISGDGNVGKEMYLKLKPDVLILDLNLPGLTGNQLLNYLCNISYEERNKCNVIVVSGEYGNNPLKYTSKVYSCLTKPYDCKLIYYFINEIYTNSLEKKNYKTTCKKIFTKLGFNPNNLGTLLMVDAVLFLLESKKDQYDMKFIYSCLSKKYNISENHARWNLERAARSLALFCPLTTFKEVFPEYTGNKNPSPKYLISLIADEIICNSEELSSAYCF